MISPISLYVAAFILLIAFVVIKKQSDTLKRANQDLDYYHTTYKTRSGATILWPGSKGEMLNYQLQSFDGGRNWYVMRSDGSNVYVQGNVEKVYPGLLSHLDAMSALVEQVEKHGPLSLGDSNSVDMLRSLGFQVKSAEGAK